MWKLWLDDQLNDPEAPARHTPEGFVGAVSSASAKRLVTELGLPAFMDLDHDLGLGDDAMVFLRWLALEAHPDGPVPLYSVHSANPVGRAAIVSYLDSWARSLG